MAKSPITTAQCQNQETGAGTMCVCVCVCVCARARARARVVLCHFTTCVTTIATKIPQEFSPKLPLYSSPPSILHPWKLLICSPVSIILSLRECYINGIVQYVAFRGWLFPHSIMPLMAIQVTECIRSLISSFIYGWCFGI